MPLKGKKPVKTKNPRIKFMISGRAGVGKTFFSLDFPKPYFIDTEGGAIRDQYIEKLEKSGGAYLGKDNESSDFSVVLNEIKELVTTKHDYKTLIIDSFSHLYLTAASIAEEKNGSKYGSDKKEANRPSRQLLLLLDKIDMNVVLICHAKDKWEKKQDKDNKSELTFAGTTFDGFEKFEYALDFWMEIEKHGKSKTFTIKKSRIDTLPEGDVFSLDFSKLANLYGKEAIEKENEPVLFANKEQIERVEKLIDVLNVSLEKIEEWKNKLHIESWEDATAEQILKVLTPLEEKLQSLNQK